MTDDSQIPRPPMVNSPYEITLRLPNGVGCDLSRVDWMRPDAERLNQREAVIVIALLRHALAAFERGHREAAMIVRGTV